MTADEQKKAAAKAALAYVPQNKVIGIGTGSTANHFIDMLATHPVKPSMAVSSSEASTARLTGHGIRVIELEEVMRSGERISIYVDGADEIDPSMAMIKGGGGALTREKIVAAASDQFVCIVDDSKLVPVLGNFALPLEVIPMAVQLICGQLTALGAKPVVREGFVTDNGNPIIDAHGLKITAPKELEATINQWPGVVTVGLFAQRGADVCIVGSPSGVKNIVAPA